MHTTKTTCPYCGVGCGVVVTRTDNGQFSVKADPTHPANQGRLCSKGTALADTLEHPSRLLYPSIQGERVSWEQATDTIATRFQAIKDQYGPEAIAFYASGQLLTEDYYVANKLMKGYIGAANIDTNSRLCMASAVVAHKRAFGEDLVPCSYQDIEAAELIVLIGSNTAWCHPVLYQRIAKAKQQNPALKVVLVDPRRTQTADIADLHLGITPGSDAFLFNGLLHYLAHSGHTNTAYVNQHTHGAEQAIASAAIDTNSPELVAKHCGLSMADVMQFFTLFAATEKVVSMFSQGINQSSSGADKGNALINCHLLTGRIGKLGMGPFSVTGQPNAMGGREVGGLANQLAAHMEIDNPEHRQIVQSFWNSPHIPEQQGLKATDLFKAVHQGKVKAIWIIATNPAVSLPDSKQVREALEKCELVIVSDCVSDTDTLRYADICLPALTWGERDGTVTNSDRTISRQRPFLSPPAEARADWQALSQVARKMGYETAFSYQSSRDIFSEHAALSAYQNQGQRCFNIGALAGLSTEAYNQLPSLQWPIHFSKNKDTAELYQGTSRLFSDGKFYTSDQRAQFIPIQPRLPCSTRSEQYPLTLNTGRVRDHWHTLTRTGISSRLSAHTTEAYAEIHPQDAKARQIEAGALLRIFNHQGEVIVRAIISAEQQQGSLFVPMHWSGEFGNSATVSRLIPSVVDPLSGQPESKHAVVQVERMPTLWQGLLLSRRKLSLNLPRHWSVHKVGDVWQYHLACDQPLERWEHAARQLLCADTDTANWVEYLDSAQQSYRAARFIDQQLESCLFISTTSTPPINNAWLISLFEQSVIDTKARQSLLSGKPTTPVADTGKTICACFNVGEITIQQAIKEQGLDSVERIGQCLQAGTNCGSCVPELRTLLTL